MAKQCSAETINKLNVLLNPHGYNVENSFFGIRISSLLGSTQPEKAHVETSFGEFCVSTLSSHWNLQEANDFQTQLNEAIELVEKANAILNEDEGN